MSINFSPDVDVRVTKKFEAMAVLDGMRDDNAKMSGASMACWPFVASFGAFLPTPQIRLRESPDVAAHGPVQAPSGDRSGLLSFRLLPMLNGRCGMNDEASGNGRKHFQGEEWDGSRRFGGVGRLYGAAALAIFRQSHVAVVGIGGVGSWAVEALARSAIGKLTLIDLDMTAESNVNRQVHALDGEFGKAKVGAMAQRIGLINPECEVHPIEDFVTPENVASLFADHYDYIVEATDQVRSKAAMIAWAQQQGVPLITAGSAGGQLDPTRIQVADLAQTLQDPLLAKVRSLLRREHGFTRQPGRKFGIPAVFSSEPVRQPIVEGVCGERRAAGGLNCAGFGSTVAVTATFGFFAAGEVLKHLAARCPPAG